MPAAMTRSISERRDYLIAGLAALAVAIHVLEAAVPSPVPGIKPGLANVVTLVALLRHGWVVAAWVSVLRVLVGSLLLGTFLGPAFFLSATGAGAALAVLVLPLLLPPATLSAVGLGVLAALAHMSAQIALAYAWLIPHPAILKLAPILLTTSLLSGLLGGIIAHAVLLRLRDERLDGRDVDRGGRRPLAHD